MPVKANPGVSRCSAALVGVEVVLSDSAATGLTTPAAIAGFVDVKTGLQGPCDTAGRPVGIEP